mmetsp:Transcript_18723/g.28908  ORF Transcript_18723/g.28908 Transcript_18723/m.28908 type:complete len:153 (+) Transcript_18723:1036-1494(+)
MYTAIKLYKNCAIFQQYISPEALTSLAVIELVGKKLVPVLSHLLDQKKHGQDAPDAARQEEVLRACEEVAAATPDPWKAGAWAERLDLFLDLLAKLAEGLRAQLRRAHHGGGGGGRRHVAKRLVEVMVDMGDSAGAKSLAELAGLRISTNTS